MTIQIIIRNQFSDKLETRKHVFNIRNINKIAYDYDATIIKVDYSTKSAVLKDSRGRLIFADRV